MSKYGIVVVGYNRIDSMRRLIKSLNYAEYSEPVDLIISIDNSGTDLAENYAKTVEWNYGKKIIKTFRKHLGLKNHVLTCGNYLNKYDYDAVIVLEDDLFVAPGFFNFAVQAVRHYEKDNRIAGISLYSHSWNMNADRPFLPLYKGHDVFFMQYPQSWGQVWMRRQWNDFFEWYKTRQYEKIDKLRIPNNVLRWPETSWLKYHIEYCIDKEMYFAYPYHSFTTNYADAGTHYAFSTNKMQVPLNLCRNFKVRFPLDIFETSVYDAYYENKSLATSLQLKENELEVDLFGLKKKYATTSRYLLSTQFKKYVTIKTFGLQMRPWELNIIYQVPGNEIFLYDLNKPAVQSKIKHLSLIHWVYDTRGEVILKRNFVDIMVNEIINKLRRR